MAKHTKIDKELVMFNTRKGMMDKADGHKHPRKGTMSKGAKEDAKNWNDAAPMMASANAKKPMVVEQMPSGAIMGRGTSAKPMSSRGAGMRKAEGAYISHSGKSMDEVPVIKRKSKVDACPECGMAKTMCKCGTAKGMMHKGASMAKGKKSSDAADKLTPAELKNLKDWDKGQYEEYMNVQTHKGARAGSLQKGATCPNCGNKMTKGMCKCMGKVAKAYTPNIPVMPKPKPAPMMARPSMTRPMPVPTAKVSKRKSGK